MKLNIDTKIIIIPLIVSFTFLGCGGGGDSSSGNGGLVDTCNLAVITDDTGFNDSYPADIAWSGNAATVYDIARVFNNARANDSTISEELVMPSQAVWDGMNIQQRGLYLLNNERYYRGIKPYEGISDKVSAVSQAYSDVLYNTGTFGHYEDGNPVERLDRDADIANNRDFFSYAENLYAHGSSAAYAQNPIAQAIYGFIYDDDAATGGSYGHRNFSLATGLNDNSGESGEEGLVGFAITKGDAYALYPNSYSTIVVMNAFDPSDTWNHSTTIKVPFCSVVTSTTTISGSGRFIVENADGTVLDTTTSLMWQNAEIAHSERADAITTCQNLTFAGESDWRLPDMAESGVFHFEMNSAGIVPQQRFDGCTAEVVSDGYVRTKKGAEDYGGNPGDPINFSGGANVRCLRSN